MITHTCDKCAKSVTQKRGERAILPTKWLSLKPQGYSTSFEYELCPECQKALGIPEEQQKRRTTVAEQLIELISDIAQEAVEE